MSPLMAQQLRIQEAIVGENPTPGLFVSEGPQLAGGFAVYLRAYRARLTAALRDNYPVLRLALGDDSFADLARAYIDAQPSRFRSIRWFGDSLADFLAATPDHLAHPALVDLARMDWAMRAAFDAADVPLMGAGDLALLAPEDWPSLRFTPVPSLQLLDLAWRIEPIWKALNDDHEASTEEPEPLLHSLLIWRPVLDCCWRSADIGEVAALQALTQGASFAECCAMIAASGDAEPAQTAAGLLARWIAEGLLAKSGES